MQHRVHSNDMTGSLPTLNPHPDSRACHLCTSMHLAFSIQTLHHAERQHLTPQSLPRPRTRTAMRAVSTGAARHVHVLQGGGGGYLACCREASTGEACGQPAVTARLSRPSTSPQMCSAQCGAIGASSRACTCAHGPQRSGP